MHFIQTGRTGGDETTPYKVTEYQATTVLAFINEVLSERPNEWGRITVIVKGKGWLCSPSVEYKHGQLLSSAPAEWTNVEIESIDAHGGWTAMDYLITPKEK